MLPALFISTLFPINSINSIQSGQATEVAAKPVNFERTYVVGVKSHYKVNASIENEVREPAQGLLTYLPTEALIYYDFYTKVLKVEAGDATIRYYRPSVFETDDDGSDSGPVTTKIPLNVIVDLTMSPINEMLDMKEIASIKKPKGVTVPTPNNATLPLLHQAGASIGLLGGLFSQLQQIAAFIGGPGSGIDLKPELSLLPVSVGSTWEKTVGYEPQEIGNGSTKTAVKRLDVKYTYMGPVKYKGKSFLEIQGSIHLDSDLQKYFEDQYHASAEETHLKSLPIKLDETLHFYLDPKTKQTIYGIVDSTGGVSFNTTDYDQPLLQIKLKGHCDLKLVSKS